MSSTMASVRHNKHTDIHHGQVAVVQFRSQADNDKLTNIESFIQ